jgi:hypothetical protein
MRAERADEGGEERVERLVRERGWRSEGAEERAERRAEEGREA